MKANRKASGESVAPRRLNRPATQINPVVAQLKSGVSSQSVKRAVAPAVYRPQALPKVLQTKKQIHQVPGSIPLVYRPQSKPLVVQAKMDGPALKT